MFALISNGHAALAILAALVVAGVLAYAFRGKEHAAIQEAGDEGKKLVGDLKEKL